MKASDRQVGGNHYRTKSGGVGHWDYCISVNVPYLEGCASKYLTRWRNKNGLQDLEKSLHYVERRIEAIHNYQGIIRGATGNVSQFKKFLLDNDIPSREAKIIDMIMHWRHISELLAAYQSIKELIEETKQEQGHPTSTYVNQDR